MVSNHPRQTEVNQCTLPPLPSPEVPHILQKAQPRRRKPSANPDEIRSLKRRVLLLSLYQSHHAAKKPSVYAGLRAVKTFNKNGLIH